MNIASAYFLNSLSILGHSEGGFGLNLDIPETNIVNLAILWFALFTFLKDPLAVSLTERKDKIQSIIADAESQLENAKIRLADAEKQYSQMNLVLEPIKKNGDIAAIRAKDSILDQGKKEIESLAIRTKSQILSKESQKKEQVFTHIVDLALKKVQSQLETNLTQVMQVKIIESNISSIGGV